MHRLRQNGILLGLVSIYGAIIGVVLLLVYGPQHGVSLPTTDALLNEHVQRRLEDATVKWSEGEGGVDSATITPDMEMLDRVHMVWKFPSSFQPENPRILRGLYVAFHGCGHDPLDWFELPEETSIVTHLLQAGYAVVAPGTQDRESHRCWTRGDLAPVKAGLWAFYRKWALPPQLPVFFVGASSGAGFASLLGGIGNIKLARVESTKIRVEGLVMQVSWGVFGSFGEDSPPSVFMPMPKDPLYASAYLSGDLQEMGKKCPPQILKLMSKVKDSRALLLPQHEIPIDKAIFHGQVLKVTSSQLQKVLGGLSSAGFVECLPKDNSGLEGPLKDCFLKVDPRGKPEILSKMMEVLDPKGDTGTQQLLLKKRLREVLNVSWSFHEMSGAQVETWEAWLWTECGERCQTWVNEGGM